MESERTDAIRDLLTAAEEAHGAYEATELGGVYDQEWPRWYAAYAVENGIGRLVGHEVDVDRLAGFLADAYAAFERADPPAPEAWAWFVARRIAAEL